MNLDRVIKHIHHTVLISDPSMIQYLCGTHFHVGERFLGLLIQDQKATLFLNKLFPYENKDLEIIRTRDDEDPILEVAQHLHTNTIKVDHRLASGFLLRLMDLKPECTFRLDSILDQLRSIKNENEIFLMREASRLNDMVMTQVPSFLKVGVLESEVKNKIIELFKQNSDGCSFDPIVAFGDHASDPHAVAQDRPLKENEAIVIDMGCIYKGYCSDMTRTFFLNSNPMKDIYDLVLKANCAAISKVKPGVLLSEIDDAARSVITEGGYGPHFIHRTGHGIGTSVHEPFPVSSDSLVDCKEGMIFSIEPGIYIEGVGGIRIEDLVLVTRSGVEVLNHTPKNAEIIVA
jgi:Xaa-Pro dipeptidase